MNEIFSPDSQKTLQKAGIQALTTIGKENALAYAQAIETARLAAGIEELTKKIAELPPMLRELLEKQMKMVEEAVQEVFPPAKKKGKKKRKGKHHAR